MFYSTFRWLSYLVLIAFHCKYITQDKSVYKEQEKNESIANSVLHTHRTGKIFLHSKSLSMSLYQQSLTVSMQISITICIEILTVLPVLSCYPLQMSTYERISLAEGINWSANASREKLLFPVVPDASNSTPSILINFYTNKK